MSNRYLEKIAELQGLEKEAFRLPLRRPFKPTFSSTGGLKNRGFTVRQSTKKKVMVKRAAKVSPMHLQALKGWRGFKNLASGASEVSGKIVDHVTGKNVFDSIKKETKIPVEKFPGAGSLHNVHGTQIDPHNPWAPPKKVSTQTPFPPGKVDRYVEHRTRPEDELKKLHEMPDRQALAWVKKNHGQAAHDEVKRSMQRRDATRVVAGAGVAYGGYKYLQGKAEEGRRQQAYNTLYGTQY